MNHVREVLDGQEEKEPAGRRVKLTEEERIFILKKVFNVPLHWDFKRQVNIAVELADKLGTDDLIGDVLTIYKEFGNERKQGKG